MGWLIFSFVVSVMLTSLIAWNTYIRNYIPNPFGQIRGTVHNGDPEVPVNSVWDEFGSDKITFILLGYDAVDEFAHRSDTLMVGAVDFYARKIRIVSIPRDTLVDIPGHGFDRINAAYALGHERLARRTVEAFTGVDIDYVVAVNYAGFVKIVDILGGVNITVENAMHYDDRRGNLHIHFDPGDYHMDGQQALEYARFRHDRTGDFGRIDRQQGLMKALFEQSIKPSTLFKLQGLANTFLENVTVDPNEDSERNPPEIELGHILSLINFMLELDSESISFTKIEVEDRIYEERMILVPIYSRTREIFEQTFRDDDPIAWKLNGDVPTSAVSTAETEFEEEVSTEVYE